MKPITNKLLAGIETQTNRTSQIFHPLHPNHSVPFHHINFLIFPHVLRLEEMFIYLEKKTVVNQACLPPLGSTFRILILRAQSLAEKLDRPMECNFAWRLENGSNIAHVHQRSLSYSD